MDGRVRSLDVSREERSEMQVVVFLVDVVSDDDEDSPLPVLRQEPHRFLLSHVAMITHTAKSVGGNLPPTCCVEEFPDAFKHKARRSRCPAYLDDMLDDVSPRVLKPIARSRPAEGLARESP
eukprot:7667744-Heterocapsa_arctica.AAC.1